MIITCPNCQSRYEVARQALGDRGRKVECAQCHANWKALPAPDEDDALFSADEEAELDAAFEREERETADTTSSAAQAPADPAVSAGGPQPDESAGTGSGGVSETQKLAGKRRALERRQRILRRQTPHARMRRALRMAICVVLFTVLGGAWHWREPIVEIFPDLAGLYAAVGIDVNVVGLDFEDIQTLRTTEDGVPSIEVSADLVNVAGRQVAVPSVLVSLANAQGATIFEWSVTPQSRAIPAGERLAFMTRLNSPPTGATHVRLSFAQGRAGNEPQDEARDGQE